MAQPGIPPIKDLRGENLRVCTVLGLDMESMGLPERRVWAVFRDQDKDRKFIPMSLPISLLPLLHVNAVFVDGVYQKSKRKERYSFTVYPDRQSLTNFDDKWNHQEVRTDIIELPYTVVEPFKEAFEDFKSRFLLCKGMPFLIFKHGLDYLVVPIMEVIRFYYTTLCSSNVVRVIFSNDLSDDNLNRIINFKRSFIEDRKVFIVLRYNLKKADRTIVACLFHSERDRFKNQAAEIISSLAQKSKNIVTHSDFSKDQRIKHPDTRSMQIGFSRIAWPFVRPTKVDFEGTKVEKSGPGERRHQVYYVHRIIKSEFHRDFDTLNYDMDNRNATTADADEREKFPIAWEERHDPAKELDPAYIDTDELSTPSAEMPNFNLLLPSPMNEEFERFPGKQCSDLPQTTRSSGQDDSGGSVGSGSVTPGADTPDGQHGSLIVAPEGQGDKPKEPRKPKGSKSSRATSLKELSGSLRALKWLKTNHTNVELTYFKELETFPIKEYLEPRSDWRFTSDGQLRQVILAQIKIDENYIYFFDSSNAGKPISSVVIWRSGRGVLLRHTCTQILKLAGDIKGKWFSDWKDRLQKVCNFKALSHSYTEDDRYALAIIKASGLDVSILKRKVTDTAHSAPDPE